MSYPQSPNPYESPQDVSPRHEPKPGLGPIQGSGRTSVDYFLAYTYITQNSSWAMNCLLLGLAMFSAAIIPIIGQLIGFGYMFEVVEGMLRNPRQPYPSFDFNRFVNYLMRGLWLFLVTLVLVVLIYIVMIAAMFLGVAITAVASQAGEAVGIIVGILFFVAMLALFVAMMIVPYPFFLRAGLSQDFVASFNFAWARDFIGRMWVEILLTQLFLMITAIPIALAGFLVLCVGIIPAEGVIMLAATHFYYQLYDIYLTRGGEPIPVKEPDAI